MNSSKLDYKSKTFRLVFSALMLALGTVLSIVSIPMPFGGSITLGAMIPLVIISQLYGAKWGLFSCLAYGLMQMLLGFDNFSYVTSIWAVLAVAFLDYLFAYGSMGLSGLTQKMKNRSLAAGLGAIIGCFFRFIFHFVCGAIVWTEWASVTALPELLRDSALASGNLLYWSYSFFYNLSYMLPEAVITALASAVIIGVIEGLQKNVVKQPRDSE